MSRHGRRVHDLNLLGKAIDTLACITSPKITQNNEYAVCEVSTNFCRNGIINIFTQELQNMVEKIRCKNQRWKHQHEQPSGEPVRTLSTSQPRSGERSEYENFQISSHAASCALVQGPLEEALPQQRLTKLPSPDFRC